jgi:uncharacterized RDD family membrane protein YckC
LQEAAENAIVNALTSQTITSAFQRAIAEHLANVDPQLVKQALETGLAEEAWEHILASKEVQMLVERIAGAPEIRAAIATQSAGLITDVGVRLTVITERLDDALERVVRPQEPDSETDQAGLATRVLAGTIDGGLLFAGYSLVADVFGHTLSHIPIVILSVLGVAFGGGILAAFWHLAGQTPGMRFLSIRLTYHGSKHVPFRRAAGRVFALPLSILPLGLGYFDILRNRQRHAWHDSLTGTEVVYDCIARGAPYSGTTPVDAAAARRHRRRAA